MVAKWSHKGNEKHRAESGSLNRQSGRTKSLYTLINNDDKKRRGLE